ncbi:radical SAM protein [Tistrella mobilis]
MTVRALLRTANERFRPGHLRFAPEWIILGVNNFCNLRCRMCDVGTGDGQTNFGGNLTGAASRSMPPDLFALILNQMAAHAPNARLGFAYTEPLAWPHLGAALDLARSHGVTTTVTTNGLLLPRQADMLARSGISILHVSIDGPRDVHDRIRGRAGSHDRAMEGIAAVTAVPGAPPVGVVCTITEWNVGHLTDFAEGLAHRHRAGARIASLVVTHNNFIDEAMAARHNARHRAPLTATASNVFAADPAKIDLDHLSRDLTRLARLDLPFTLHLQPRIVDPVGLATYYRDPARPIGRRCRDAFRILMIDADGAAIPAHGRCFRMDLGNIRETSLDRLWRAPALDGLRRNLVAAGGLMPACTRCCSAMS